MSSFRDLREMLVLSYGSKFISDEEFCLLYDAFQSKNPDFLYDSYPPFVLDDVEEAECKVEFRVEKQDLPRLLEVLRIPPSFKCEQRSICDGMQGLCMLLRRVCYPCRYSDMIPRFGGRPVSVISLITNHIIDYIFEEHEHLITTWNHNLLSPAALQSYADAVSRKGAPLGNCFGFVDGTVRPICKPGKNQRVVYNGHKRVHAIKFQSLALPNGLIGNLFGPTEGRRHDAGILVESGLLQNLQQYAFSPTGQSMCIYGDMAYPLRVHLQTPFRQRQLTPLMQEYNKSMSATRISVEWLFGDIVNSFKFTDYKKI